MTSQCSKWLSRRVLWSVLLLPSWSLLGQQILTLGDSRSFDLSRSRRASFSISVQSRTVAHLRLDQLDGDVKANIFGPNETVREVDAFDFGTESVTILAEVSGNYRIEVVPAAKSIGVVKGTILFESVEALKAEDDQETYAEDLATKSKKTTHDGTELTEAVQTAGRSLEAWRVLGAPFSVARTHLRLGDIYFRHNDWGQARAAYREAEQLCTTLSNLRCEAEAANNVGLSALNLSDVEEALSEFEIASAGWNRLHMVFGEAVTRSNLGLLYWQTSEWQQALREYQRARDLFKRLSPLSYARVLNNLGLVYMSMAEFDRAAAYFTHALSLRPSDKASRREAGRFQLNLGRAHMLAGRLGPALVDEQKALVTLESVQDTTGIADVYNNLGQIQLRMNRRTAARSSLDLALKLYRDLGDRRGLASALHYLGVLATQTGDLAEARSLLQQALEIQSERRLQDQAAETLYRLAVVEQQAHEFEEAIRGIDQAIAITESLRVRVVGEPLRRAYFANKQTYSEFLVEILMSQRTVSDSDRLAAQAFEVTERTRARALLDVLGEDRLALKVGADPGLLSRQRSVRRRLNFKSSQLAAFIQSESKRSDESVIRREIDELLSEDAEIERSLREKNPEYRSLAEPPLIGLDGVQHELLGENDVLVEYFLGERHSYAWIISRDSFRVKDLIQRDRIERLAHGVVDSFEDAQERKADPRKGAQFALALKQLGEALGLPYAVDTKRNRLLIVPDGILNRVPFAALPSGTRSTDRSSVGAPLGLQYELVQAPSASVFKVLQGRRAAVAALPRYVTAFADPVFDMTDSRVVGTSSGAQGSSAGVKASAPFELPRLPFSQLEAETIERLVPVSQRTTRRGFEATRAAFLDERTWQSSLVLASTHAFADDVQPELSSIVFSMVAKNGKAVDGLVRLYDIYDLAISSSIVVLSACETARGRQDRGGEGLVGISRGFIFSGASALLAPLNRVDAEGSATLIAGFLQGVLGPATLPPSRALLEARTRLAQSRRWKDPYYWSSFVLVSGWD